MIKVYNFLFLFSYGFRQLFDLALVSLDSVDISVVESDDLIIFFFVLFKG